MVRGEFLAATEMFRLHHPGVPIVCLIQNPQQNNSNMATAFEAYMTLAARRDVALVDGYTPFIAAGKPNSYYNDLNESPIVHPSDVGFDQIAAAFRTLWNNSPPLRFVADRSLLEPNLVAGQNLLTNGDFSKWTTSPGAPDGWTANGTITVSKDTTIVRDPRLGYSAKLLGTGGSTSISQDIGAGVYGILRGLPVSLMAWLYRPTSATGTVGRIAITAGSPALGTQTITSRSYNVNQVGWVPWIISGFTVPSDVTFLRVILYHDTAGTPSAVASHFDQAVLVPGYLPRAIR
jgi:hypothetical protein